MITTLAASIAISLTLLSPDASTTDLPDRHRKSVEPLAGEHAASFILQKDQSTSIRCRLGFDGIASNRVSFNWFIKKDGVSGFDRQDISTSFIPLAVAPEARRSDAVFVIGWAERTGGLIVEKWVMRNAAVGVTAGGGGTQSISFVAPTIVKTEVLRDPYLLPCMSAVFHPVSRKLLMLCDVQPSSTTMEILSVDVDSPNPTAISIYDASDIPLLVKAKGMKVSKTTSGAIYVTIHESLNWESPSLGPLDEELAEPSAFTHVMKDDDADGIFDQSYTQGYSQAANELGVLSWNSVYESP